MKKISLLLSSLFLSITLLAQGIDSLVTEGVENYNRRNYKTAFEKFKAAMKINPNHSEASKWYWKMKKEHDVASLTDSNLPVEVPATDSKPAADAAATSPAKLEAGSVKTSDAPVVRTQKEIQTVIVRTEPDKGRMSELDRKLSAMQDMLRRINENEKKTEQKPEVIAVQQQGISSDLKLLILVPLALMLVLLVSIILLIMMFRRKRAKFADYYAPPAQHRDAILYDGRGQILGALPPALPERKQLLIEGGSSTSTALVPFGSAAADGNGPIQANDPDFIKFESFANGYIYLLEKKYQRGENTRKIKTLVNEIGIRLGLSKEEILELRIASILRDIGFLMIPEKIILKKESLTKQETMEIFRHPLYSSEMLQAMNMPQRIIESVSYHHERSDGSGYPNGMRGDDIPLYARVIGLCESFVSLTTDKPYKKAISSTDALSVLTKESHLFDANILAILIAIVKEAD